MEDKAAQEKVDHARQYGNGHNVCHKAVGGADGAVAQKADREIALQQVDAVDEQIEDESPCDQRVKNAGAASDFPQVAEGQPSAGRAPQPFDKLSAGWERPRAPPDHKIDPSELNVAQIEGEGNRGHKEQFLGKGQHSSRRPFRCMVSGSVFPPSLYTPR